LKDVTVSIKQNLINHVAFVLDGSGSMQPHKRDVISVFDGQIAWLAKRSQELDQETRVTVYVFDNRVECVIFDKDVLRLPSIKDLYWVRNSTALRDATIKSQQDLAKAYTEYGDHAFMTFVITDGKENASVNSHRTLAELLSKQPENWTVAALVPNMRGKLDAQAHGFPQGNIEVWDINSTSGIAEVGEKIQAATDSYMTSRASGVRGSKTLFAGSAQQVNAATVQAAGLSALDPDRFFLIPVASDGTIEVKQAGKPTRAKPNGTACVVISDFVRSTGRPYELGKGFYELVKSEKIDPQKQVAVVERATSKVYVGREARKLIGLDDTARRVRPMPKDSSGSPPFKIFVQSTSVNRLLPLYTQLLLLK
jgi:hypothetical protein